LSTSRRGVEQKFKHFLFDAELSVGRVTTFKATATSYTIMYKVQKYSHSGRKIPKIAQISFFNAGQNTSLVKIIDKVEVFTR
jgi:hypothetical protein